MARGITTAGAIPTLTIDGRTFTDLTTLIKLYTHNTTAGRYGTCRKQDGSGTGYAAVATLRIAAIRVNLQSGTSSSVKMMRSDNDVTFDSSTAPTNPNYYGNMNTTHFLVAGLGSKTDYAVDFAVSVGKFLTFDNVTNADQAIHAWGYDT